MPVLRVLFSDGVGFYSVCVRVLSGIFWGWELLRKTICKWQQITILNYFCFKTLHSLLGLKWLKLAEAGVQPALLSSLYTQCVQKAKPEVMNVAQHWYYFCEFTETKRFYDWKNMLKKIGRCTLTYHQVRVLKKTSKEWPPLFTTTQTWRRVTETSKSNFKSEEETPNKQKTPQPSIVYLQSVVENRGKC